MNEFSGLGILVEENETSGSDTQRHSMPGEVQKIDGDEPAASMTATEDEILLPPLPDEDEDLYRSSSLRNSTAEVKSLNGEMVASDDVNTFDSNASKEEESNRDSAYSDFFHSNASFSTYELDSPSLKFDPSYSIFPSLTSKESNSGNHSHLQPTNNGASSSTSPLKRLKSLKKGIRKLSLSSNGSNSGANTPKSFSSTSAMNRPVLNPLQTDILSRSQESSISANFNTEASSADNSSVGSVMMAKARRSTTRSNSNATSSTPPSLTSPIITLSENSITTKTSLSTLEQSYLETMVSSTSPDSPNETSSEIRGIDLFKSPDELINYSEFLKHHKKSVVEAFELTKARLIESGWCSDHDLNNLQLQEDTSLCQIDTRLLQIEEQLNEKYDSTLLSNERRSSSKSLSRGDSGFSSEDNSRSSLKMLESRCFSYSTTN